MLVSTYVEHNIPISSGNLKDKYRMKTKNFNLNSCFCGTGLDICNRMKTESIELGHNVANP